MLDYSFFKNKSYFLTGGGSGIGRELCLELCKHGAHIFIVGRDEKKLNETLSICKHLPGQVDLASGDLRDPETVKKLVTQGISKLKKIDGLINNAGGQFPSKLENISPNGWTAVVNNNLNAIFYVSREMFLQWMKKNGGVILNMAAENRNGMPLMGHSGAARAGTINLTMTAAIEWAPYNIRVNAIAPGLIESTGLEKHPDDFKKTLSELKKKIPMKRFGSLKEIVDPMMFLLSPAANFITGITLPVDGGQRLQGPM